MRGLMMDTPLLVSSLIEHAAVVFGSTEIVTRTVEGPIHRYTWREALHRSKQLAQALQALGVRGDDRVATIAWNTHRHLEIYYGVSGSGAVVHTVNPRLHPGQLTYVLNHAEDRVLCVDLSFVPLVEAVWDQLRTVKHLVVMTDRASMPATKIPGALCYEELLAAQKGDFQWPVLDERAAAAICYTSGTTGNPKGVVYSHRSTVLHAYGSGLPSALPVGPADALLPVVPMFHVNAWGIPYAAAMCGYKLVMPGPRLDGPGLTELMNLEGVTIYCGVPTVHLALLGHWDETGTSVPTLKCITSGGAAAGRSMIRRYRDRGIDVVHGWGMTETSPIGTISKITAADSRLSDDDQVELLARQGRPLAGVELRTVDLDGKVLPRDGKSAGELQIRGPWVCDAYLGDEPGSALVDGWFPTGDVAVLHPNGVMQITDRVKDLIKSGGEWISSIDLEDAAGRHPEVAMAAVIGIPHEKWGERPLLLVQAKPGAAPTKEDLLDFLEEIVAKFWLPDDVVFVDSLPMGATGKVQKSKLRETYAGG
ncbi:MAG TPA: long-chain-fatty-acid--CoA ligase [Longimicrobiales bacterium]|nr:long-chain-fatty-acid--CoA ligase [Longimicrobiales bacterium]